MDDKQDDISEVDFRVLKDTDNLENDKLKRRLEFLHDDVKSLTDRVYAVELNCSYQPGIITETVTEIRKAAEVREQAVFSKAEEWLKDSVASLNNFTAVQGDYVSRGEFNELKNQFIRIMNEKENFYQRVELLEEVIRDLSIRQPRELISTVSSNHSQLNISCLKTGMHSQTEVLDV